MGSDGVENAPQRGTLIRRAHELLESQGQPVPESVLIRHLFGADSAAGQALWTILLRQTLRSSTIFEETGETGIGSELLWSLKAWRSTQQLLNDVEFVVLDTETTGLRPGPDRVIEVAGVRVRGGQVRETFQSLINPGRRIPPFIAQFTGITQEMLLDAPTAKEVAAGAQVVAVLGAEPDGTNINHECGSTHPGALARAVLAQRADIGLAFDGDADRVIAVAADGQVVDGDRILALLARDMHQRGLLGGGTVVVTVMTNLGFHRAMDPVGVKVHTVAVGDRYVLEALDANGWSLGGEQSGHIVFRSLATTGDGVLSGLMLADLVRRMGAPLHELAGNVMDKYPQVLSNVRVARREALAAAAEVWAEVARVEASLGREGRVVLRPSGTEPLVRVMVEARTEGQARECAGRLVDALHRALGEAGPAPSPGLG